MANPNPNTEGLKPFKEGQSGNPAGKPKGSKSMKTILREMMELMVDNPKGQLTEQYSKDNKISVKEMLVMQDIINAQKGNEKAKQRIWEYLEGKPDQHQVFEVKQPQTKSEMIMQLKQYADRNGLTLQEYCEREGVDIAAIPDDLDVPAIEGENAPTS